MAVNGSCAGASGSRAGTAHRYHGPAAPRDRPTGSGPTRGLAMYETLSGIYQVALLITLWATAIGLGASHDPRSLGVVLRRRPLFARLLVLDAVVVPLLVAVLVRVVNVPSEYAVGLLIVGAAAAGPLGLKTAELARGDLPLAVALIVMLELVNIVALPIWATILLPTSFALPLAEIWRTLLIAILVPLVIGSAIFRTSWAPTVARLAPQVSTIGLAVVVAVVLARDWSTVLGALGSGVVIVSIATILAALVLGWWLSGSDPASRRTAALVSSVRASAIALAVTSVAFGPASAATSAVVVFALCSLVIVPCAALVMRHAPAASSVRRTPSTDPVP
jgi:BASS family bile acid:Na+ symporter